MNKELFCPRSYFATYKSLYQTLVNLCLRHIPSRCTQVVYSVEPLTEKSWLLVTGIQLQDHRIHPVSQSSALPREQSTVLNASFLFQMCRLRDHCDIALLCQAEATEDIIHYSAVSTVALPTVTKLTFVWNIAGAPLESRQRSYVGFLPSVPVCDHHCKLKP